MAKSRSWFTLLKKLFISDTKAEPEKKEKRKRWIFGKFKWRRLPTIAAPPPVKERRLSEAEREHSKRALNVAVATAAAAEAAVAATQAAVELVRLSGGAAQTIVLTDRTSRELAAIKIQTAFRGYLARKALRALKGLVRLQAMVRGQVVRRQAITTLKGLQSLVKIQTQVRATRVRLVENGWTSEEKQQLLDEKELEENKAKLKVNCEKLVDSRLPNSEEKKQLYKDKELEEHGKKLKLNCQRRLDNYLHLKTEADVTLSNRHEALNKRDRIKEFLLNHPERRNSRKQTEYRTDKGSRKPSIWSDQWVEEQEQTGRKAGNFESIASSNPSKRNGEGRTVLGFRDLQNYEQFEDLAFVPRRSFHKPKRVSIGEHDSLGSPGIPNYMLATESAKAKLRSSSTPRQRRGFLDAFLDLESPSKNRLSFSSINSDATSTIKNTRASSSQQISPRLKALLGPVRSYRSTRDLSFNSECSLLNWDQHGILK